MVFYFEYTLKFSMYPINNIYLLNICDTNTHIIHQKTLLNNQKKHQKLQNKNNRYMYPMIFILLVKNKLIP